MNMNDGGGEKNENRSKKRQSHNWWLCKCSW
jgi:hypothetical protein